MIRGAPGTARGFTLLETIVALSIAGAVLVITFAGFRVGLAAWQRGEARTVYLDHERGRVVLIERALAGAFPYRVVREDIDEPRILFDGRPDRLTFATLSPPFPAPVPIAFTAVSLSADAAGLALRQQVLPNHGSVDGLPPILVDPETTAVRFRYLGKEPDTWRDQWNVSAEEALPRAVQITLVTGAGKRRGEQAFTMPIQATGQ